MPYEQELHGSIAPASLNGTVGVGNVIAWENVDGKPSTFPPSSHTHTQSQVTGLTNALSGKADASEMTTALATKQDKLIAGANIYFSDDGVTINATGGGGGGGGSVSWNSITDKPSTFTPSSHTHAQSDITNLSTTLSGKQDKLVAGTGITIAADGKTISASGGSTSVAWSNVTGKPSTYPPSTHSHNMFDYSASEQAIGTWVDGKTLYRKVIVDSTTHTVQNALTETTIATVGLSGAIDTMVSIEGGYHVSGTGWMQLCRVRSASILSGVNYHQSSDTIRLYTVGASYTLDKVVVILTYTRV